MKVQLLYLDPHDDHVSVRDKLGWVKAPRLLIVWPRHGRVLTRRLDLRLVQRQAESRGSQLGLVSFDPDVRDHAAELGIPVFDSADTLPESVWQAQAAVPTSFERRAPDRQRLERPARRPAVSPSSSGWGRGMRWAAFTLGLAAVGALALALIPSATIVLTPQTRTQQINFELALDPSIDAPAADGRVPAMRRSVTVEGHLRQPVSGTILAATAAATGQVTFTNLGQVAVTLPEGTGLLAGPPSNVRFITSQTVHLAAGEGSQISVGIMAAEKGPAGNVGPGAIYAIEGPLGLQVSVTNPESTSGGEARRKPAVSSADLAQLQSRLQSDLLTQAGENLSDGLGSGEAWDPASLAADHTLQADYDAEVGDVAETVSLTMRLEASGLVYSLPDVQAASAAQLDSRLSHGTAVVPGSLRVTILPAAETPGGLRVTARELIFDLPSEVALAQLAAGLPPAQARAVLVSRLDPVSVQLVLSPAWLPRVPWLPVRIDLRYAWEGV